MTVPVLTSYIPNEDKPGPPKPEDLKNFTVSFYLQPKIAVSQLEPLAFMPDNDAVQALAHEQAMLLSRQFCGRSCHAHHGNGKTMPLSVPCCGRSCHLHHVNGKGMPGGSELGLAFLMLESPN